MSNVGDFSLRPGRVAAGLCCLLVALAASASAQLGSTGSAGSHGPSAVDPGRVDLENLIFEFGACCFPERDICFNFTPKLLCQLGGGDFYKDQSCQDLKDSCTLTLLTLGACCDLDSESVEVPCKDNVPYILCLLFHEKFTPNASCDDLGPDCGSPSGACCLTTGICLEDVTEDECSAQSGTFYPGTTCGDPNLPCAIGACCNTQTGLCVDNTPKTECTGASEVFTAGVACENLEPPCRAPRRLSTSQKGSLLIFPRVEIRLSPAGELLRETFISISNDFDDDVHVIGFFVSEDCEKLYTDFNLTALQPRVWAASTGKSSGGALVVAPLEAVPGGLKTDPATGERYQRGFYIAFAADQNNLPIRWNHLTGLATIVDYSETSAWEYSPYASQVVDPTIPHGGVVSETGELLLDGLSYDAPFNRLLLDFAPAGSIAFSGAGVSVVLDPEIALLIADIDVRQDKEIYRTKARFSIYNEDEISFTGEYCLTCWDCRRLADIAPTLTSAVLATDRARALIDGVASPTVCDIDPRLPLSSDRALLGTQMTRLTFGAAGSVEWIGSTMPGTGLQSAQILYDVPSWGGED